MSLTFGGGPLAPDAAGVFNHELGLPETLLYFHPYPPRVRGMFEGETVVDSLETKLLHETGRLPVFYFPLDDVRDDLLERSQTSVDVPAKGTARYRSLRVGERTVADAAWGFEQPLDTAGFLSRHIAFEWPALDEWFTEDEQVFGHPRDPYSRIDVLKTTRHVRVSVEGELLADTRRAKVLYETALPPRFYIPPEDVRTELLVASSNRSRCAYKGSASYWHVRIGERMIEDLVWSYRDPQHDARPVADYLCFFDERVDLDVDGVRSERPRTQWSRESGDESGGQALRGLMAKR